MPSKQSPRLTRSYNGIAPDERIAGRRQRFLEAALECFGTAGYHATGVKDLSRQADLTHRYFYESFADKQALFLAVFDWITSELFEINARAILNAEPTPDAQMRASVTAFFNFMAEDPRRPRIIFTQTAAAGPEVERHARTVLRQFTRYSQANMRAYYPASVPDGTIEIGAVAITATLGDAIREWQDGALQQSLHEAIENTARVLTTLLHGLSQT